MCLIKKFELGGDQRKLKMYQKLSIRYCLIIVLFGMLAPTMDQISDLNLVLRLMSGPDEDTHLNSGDIFRENNLLIDKNVLKFPASQLICGTTPPLKISHLL